MIKVEIKNDDGEIVELEINKDGSVDVFDYDIEEDIIAAELGDEQSNVLDAVYKIEASPIGFLLLNCEWLGDRCWGAILCDWAIDSMENVDPVSYKPIYDQMIEDLYLAKRYWLKGGVHLKERRDSVWNLPGYYGTQLAADIAIVSRCAINFGHNVKMTSGTDFRAKILITALNRMLTINRVLNFTKNPSYTLGLIKKYQKLGLCNDIVVCA